MGSSEGRGLGGGRRERRSMPCPSCLMGMVELVCRLEASLSKGTGKEEGKVMDALTGEDSPSEDPQFPPSRLGE